MACLGMGPCSQGKLLRAFVIWDGRGLQPVAGTPVWPAFHTRRISYEGHTLPPPPLPPSQAKAASYEESAALRRMILTMVAEPLVILVKLSDRLHNMRTV